ncbi:hypothetical protein GCK32_019360, partial [Trichostrongylus colubriformis]
GDYDFAEWHDATFPYSYRINHHHDPVPHQPPMRGNDELFHYRYEVCTTTIWLLDNRTRFAKKVMAITAATLPIITTVQNIWCISIDK